jgi:hypothetical protein
MSKTKKRSFLSWLFLQDPITKNERKMAQKPHVQSSMNVPVQFQKVQQVQSLCMVNLLIRSKDIEDDITIDTFPAIIGRVDDGETTIVIEDNSISKRHASILLRNNTFYIIDNDSKNGVRLMGQTLTPGVATPIKQGDILKLGRVEIHVDDAVVEMENKENQTDLLLDNEYQSEYYPRGSHTLPVASPVVTPAPGSVQTQPVPVQMPVRTPPAQISNVRKFCTGCGKENIGMKSFCGSCGKNLQI